MNPRRARSRRVAHASNAGSEIDLRRTEAIASTIESFIRPGAPGIERIEFRVLNIAATGPVVMTERVDVFTLPGKTFELQVMGTFEVRDGKISAWRDYFDQAQFSTRMG